MNFDRKPLSRDFSSNGTRLEGPYENDRNAIYANLYKAIIREVYNVKDVICGHHLVYVAEEAHKDGFTYQLPPQEIPSADTLIFDHFVAEKLWGSDYLKVLARLACEPIETRDETLARLYYRRPTHG